MSPRNADGRASRLRRRAAYLTLLALSALWTAGIALPALAAATGLSVTWYPLLRLAYAPFCHQEAARCFHAGGTAFAVCHRCAAIYAAFTMAVALYPLLRRVARPLPSLRGMARFHAVPLDPVNIATILALLPMALDVLLDAAGILSNTAASRVATGALAGAVLGCHAVAAFMEAWTPRRAIPCHPDIPDHTTDTVR